MENKAHFLSSGSSPSSGETDPIPAGSVQAWGMCWGIAGALSARAKGATFELNLILRRFLGERESPIFQP